MRYCYELEVILENNEAITFLKDNKNIYDIDEFTSRFDSLRSLKMYLEDSLKNKIKDVKLKYTYEQKEKQVKKYMDILYFNDIFDYEDLIFKYSSYLRKRENIDELRRLVYALYSRVSINMRENLIDEVKTNLEAEVRRYLNTYRKKRDCYFWLKKNNIKVRCGNRDIDYKHDTMEEHVSKFYSDDEQMQDVLDKEDLDYLFSIYDLDELRGIRSDLTSSFLVDGLGKDVRKK